MNHTKKTVLISMAVCSLLFSTGCVQTRGNNATTGTIIGGLTGALATGAYHNSTATVLGTLAGALIGSEIGSYMDELDRQYANEAFDEATSASVGRVIVWNNPRTCHHGRVVVIREGYTPRGRYYREFQHQLIMDDGRVQKTYRKAAKRHDGSWEAIP